jgi:hypothetical protein
VSKLFPFSYVMGCIGPSFCLLFFIWKIFIYVLQCEVVLQAQEK